MFSAVLFVGFAIILSRFFPCLADGLSETLLTIQTTFGTHLTRSVLPLVRTAFTTVFELPTRLFCRAHIKLGG